MEWTDPRLGQTFVLEPTDALRRDLAQFHSTECRHPEMSTRKRKMKDGRIEYRDFCLTCGHSGKALKQELFKTPPPDFDPAIEDAYYKARAVAFDAVCRKHAKLQMAEYDENNAEYEAYLASPEWQEKRLKVLERDNWLCQGCRARPATEVHHLTYAHIYDELLFELIALCKPCHDRLRPWKPKR